MEYEDDFNYFQLGLQLRFLLIFSQICFQTKTTKKQVKVHEITFSNFNRHSIFCRVSFTTWLGIKTCTRGEPETIHIINKQQAKVRLEGFLLTFLIFLRSEVFLSISFQASLKISKRSEASIANFKIRKDIYTKNEIGYFVACRLFVMKYKRKKRQFVYRVPSAAILTAELNMKNIHHSQAKTIWPDKRTSKVEWCNNVCELWILSKWWSILQKCKALL